MYTPKSINSQFNTVVNRVEYSKGCGVERTLACGAIMICAYEEHFDNRIKLHVSWKCCRTFINKVINEYYHVKMKTDCKSCLQFCKFISINNTCTASGSRKLIDGMDRVLWSYLFVSIVSRYIMFRLKPYRVDHYLRPNL